VYSGAASAVLLVSVTPPSVASVWCIVLRKVGTSSAETRLFGLESHATVSAVASSVVLMSLVSAMVWSLMVVRSSL
jgi:hypothetical protein